jgi:hypothetical protein
MALTQEGKSVAPTGSPREAASIMLPGDTRRLGASVAEGGLSTEVLDGDPRLPPPAVAPLSADLVANPSASASRPSPSLGNPSSNPAGIPPSDQPIDPLRDPPTAAPPAVNRVAPAAKPGAPR